MGQSENDVHVVRRLDLILVSAWLMLVFNRLHLSVHMDQHWYALVYLNATINQKTNYNQKGFTALSWRNDRVGWWFSLAPGGSYRGFTAWMWPSTHDSTCLRSLIWMSVLIDDRHLEQNSTACLRSLVLDQSRPLYYSFSRSCDVT